VDQRRSTTSKTSTPSCAVDDTRALAELNEIKPPVGTGDDSARLVETPAESLNVSVVFSEAWRNAAVDPRKLKVRQADPLRPIR
jgi:hypothetical protein